MTQVAVSQEAREKRATFFRIIFGQSQGYVCIAFLTEFKKFREEFYRYPQELDLALASIESNILNHNVYFCPQLFSSKKRAKETVAETPNAWADLDTCNPEELLVQPTVTIESSPRRYQALWVFDKAIDADDAEDLSRRIAYLHANQGADRTGWDLTQLLRVPGTYNYKYKHTGQIPTVKIIAANRNLYRLNDFKDYPETPEYVQVVAPIPAQEDLLNGLELLQARNKSLNPLIWRLFNEQPDASTSGGWSAALWNLQMLLFESGFTREEVYAIVREAQCNKYARDGRPAILLWKEVCRAEARATFNEQLLNEPNDASVALLTDEERRVIETYKDSFVERYIEWAKKLGDAAPQYHEAGAFIILSSLLCGSVRLPTSYGTVIPNLWFMILADTTLTRKTTSMDIAMDLVAELDDSLLMATDGSLEGLMSSLAARSGKPSVFLRDEFSGLLEAMTRKDYMAGMAEAFTKLYDGKFQRRILRKEAIEIRDPRLIIFAGGIKNKVTGLLTFEHVSSGFMPRFIFITAESDLSRLKPIGPPNQILTNNKAAILEEMADMLAYYTKVRTLKIEKLQSTIEQAVTFEAELTPEAWMRYNVLESKLLEAGLKTNRPEIMTPIGDRLAKSILKAAVLLAASRQRNENIIVELSDVLRAIKYGEHWRKFAIDVMSNVGKGSSERQLDTILASIERKPQGATRSKIMQTYHLTAREANAIFDTLEQRGKITRQKQGRTELLVPRYLEDKKNG